MVTTFFWSTVFYYVEFATLLYFVFLLVDYVVGNRSLPLLENVAPLKNAGLPKVSIVIAARNESVKIEKALRSVLGLSYADFEVIVVDDRSEDNTGEILSSLREKFSNLKVVTVDALPDNWMGKNHALSEGAKRAAGTLILFTDADVVFEATTLNRAVKYMIQHRIDHVTITPRVVMPGHLLNLLQATFVTFFPVYCRPWLANNPKRKSHVGIGAFNLIRRLVYEELGGHGEIALRPDDDIRLGKLVKQKGFRQAFVLGGDLLTVEWYSSLKELTAGLMKNIFAALHYRVTNTLLLTLAIGWGCLAPWFFVVTLHGPLRIVNIAILIITAAIFVDNARFYRTSGWYVLGFPLAVLFVIFILWKATLRTLRQQGIYWRETFYPLPLLRQAE